MLVHKRAYSNDNRLIVLPALNGTEVNQKQFSLIQLGKAKYSGSDDVWLCDGGWEPF